MAKSQPREDVKTLVVQAQVPPAPTEQDQQALAWITTCTAITSVAVAADAALVLRRLRDKVRDIDARWKAVRAPINAALKQWSVLAAIEARPYQQADSLVATALLDWDRREEARVKRDSESALRAAEDEAHRRRDEQLQALSDAAAAAPTKTAQAGLERQARALARAPVMPTSIAQVEGSTALPGVHASEQYDAEVTDLAALIASVARGATAQAALLPNQKWLDGQASALREEFAIPGVRVVRSKTLSARRLA